MNPDPTTMRENLNALRANKYPGRLIVVSKYVTAYALTGRRPSSRGRWFVESATGYQTTSPTKTPGEMAAEPDAALIYYQATLNRAGLHVVTNGAQTEPIMHNMIDANMDFEQAVKKAPRVPDGKGGMIDLSIYEPDKPNFTSRISAIRDLRPGAQAALALSVVRRDPRDGLPHYSFSGIADFENLDPNVAYVVHTYNGDAPEGEPLPSFDKKVAYPVQLKQKDAKFVAETVMDWLNDENRVAVLAHSYDIDTGELAESHAVSIHDKAA